MNYSGFELNTRVLKILKFFFFIRYSQTSKNAIKNSFFFCFVYLFLTYFLHLLGCLEINVEIQSESN